MSTQIDPHKWQDSDPREFYSNNRAQLLVFTVDSNVYGASVSTKDTWSVFLQRNHTGRVLIDPDQEWPKGWL